MLSPQSCVVSLVSPNTTKVNDRLIESKLIRIYVNIRTFCINKNPTVQLSLFQKSMSSERSIMILSPMRPNLRGSIKDEFRPIEFPNERSQYANKF
ncbi:hypothetical protein HanIR_Chr03g0147881 [Helianthus annuus]|nr:hypothetical protein HanIR_Chr03g0147881 [Helianthus annuus]